MDFKSAKVFWFTGLSGAGKTTLGLALSEILRKQNHKVEFLDGDIIRELFPLTGYSRNERNEHVKRVGYLASRLESHGIYVVVSLISPFEESRQFARGLSKNFCEIYLSTPLKVCEERDIKGLYKKARAGEIKNFTGIDDVYEIPKTAEIIIDTSKLSIESSLALILKGQSCL